MAILFPEERNKWGNHCPSKGGDEGDTCPQTRHRPSGAISCCTLWTAPSGLRHSCLGWCVGPSQSLDAQGFPYDLRYINNKIQMCLGHLLYMPSMGKQYNGGMREGVLAWWVSSLTQGEALRASLPPLSSLQAGCAEGRKDKSYGQPYKVWSL